MTTYPNHDQWGRPKILLPGAKKEEPFTRVTTVAKALDGFEALTDWKMRMVAEGACLRPDLLAQYAAALPATDKNKAQLNGYVEELKEAAAASAGANMGDALHTMTERVDRGEKFRPLPPFDVDVKAYLECLERYGIEIVPEYIERTVILPEHGVAGSFDRLVRKAGRLWVSDLKTGRTLDHSWPAIAIQLALYSRATWLYDWDTKTCEPMPEVDQKSGLVLWLPAGKGIAELHVVDLEAGWEAAQQALWVRSWRTRKDLARAARQNGKGH